MSTRLSLGRQAALRLIISLGLFIVLIATATTVTYQTTLEKTAQERAEEFAAFFTARLMQLERDWELSAKDIRIRIEFTRILEHPANARLNLQAFLTSQGVDRRYNKLIIQKLGGERLFTFGEDLALETIPLASGEAEGQYYDVNEGRVYRVFQDNIWLGEHVGMGRIGVFYRIDNALLQQLAAPGITLSLLYDGKPVASSGGQESVDRLLRRLPTEGSAYRVLPWTMATNGALRLHMDAPVHPLFSAAKLTTMMSAIPLVDALILWFTIGMWLLWQTRRLTALRQVVEDISATTQFTAPVEYHFQQATGDRVDEIADVAKAIRVMAGEIARRESENTRLISDIHERSRQLEAILGSAGNGIFGLDCNGQTTFANRAAVDLLGWSLDDLNGRFLHDVIHHTKPDALPNYRHDCPVMRVLSDQIARSISSDVFWHRDGTPVPVDYTCTPIFDNSGETNGAVIVFNDIRDRLGHEKERLARVAAEEANKAKSLFLANMSHEIRTPMNAILGFTNIILNSKTINDHDLEHVKIIYRAGNNLLNLINDVLEMSKIEAGRAEMMPKTFDLRDLLDDIHTMFQATADAKGLRWQLTVTPDLPSYVVTDDRMVRQILVNLIGNALKFTDCGSVVLTAGMIADRQRLTFVVEDTGPGLSEAEMSKLFEAFQQASAGIKKGGTGLGLAISRHFSNLLEGTLTVRSAPGIGCAFELSIPYREGCMNDIVHAIPLRRILRLKPGQPTQRILVVDDKADNRLYLRRLLEPIGFVLCEATTGLEALAQWRQARPELILMDMVMPTMNGQETTHRIREHHDGQSVKIIVLSASAFEEDRAAVLATGANDFIRKPVSSEELLEAIGQQLGVSYEYDSSKNLLPIIVEASKTILTDSDLSSLPTSLRDLMIEATYHSDDNAMIALINQLPVQQKVMAETLRRIVSRFEWEVLERWLQMPKHR